MIRTPERDPAPRLQRSVVLRKANGEHGPLPVGGRFEWTYTSSARPAAVERAKRALRRAYPDERAECWEVVEP